MTMESNGTNPVSQEIQHSGNLASAGNEKPNEIDAFVNHGTVIFETTDYPIAEIAWHEGRKEWLGDASKKLRRMPREPIMCWTTTYEDLLSSSEPFYEPIALSEMVDFLVDIWQDEGLYG